MYSTQNSEYRKLNNSWHVEDSLWKAIQIVKLITKNKLEFSNLSEIGCGAGEILVQLQKHYANPHKYYWGFDIAPDLKTYWEERSNSNLQFQLLDIYQLNKFTDILLIIDVIEHVEDYYSFIKATQNKGNYKIFHIPLDISVIGILRNMPMYFRQSVGHIHYFTEETALASLKDCGLEVIDFIYTAGSIEVHNKSIKSKVLNLLRWSMFKLNKKWTNRILGGYSILVLTK